MCTRLFTSDGQADATVIVVGCLLLNFSQMVDRYRGIGSSECEYPQCWVPNLGPGARGIRGHVQMFG